MTTSWRRFLHWYSGRLPLRIVTAGAEGENRTVNTFDTPLFERYYVGRIFGCGVYLHHYLRSDPDHAPHNHPWPWALVFPLAGGYWEWRPKRIGVRGLVIRAKWRRPFKPYVLTENTFHRVVVDPEWADYAGVGNWSLFIHGPRSGEGWGFLRDLSFGCDTTAKVDAKGGWSTISPVYFDPAIDKTSSKALGRPWHQGAPKGRDVERAAA